MKTFGYLLMAVMACMTCSCRDEEPLPDPVPPVMEPENPGNPEEPDTGKVYLGIAPIIENMQEQRAVVENWKEGHCLGVTAAGDVNIPFTFDGRRWKAEKQVEVTAEQKVSAYYPYNVQYTDMTARTDTASIVMCRPCRGHTGWQCCSKRTGSQPGSSLTDTIRIPMTGNGCMR